MKSRHRNFLSRWIFDCSSFFFFFFALLVLSRRFVLFILWSLEVNRRRMEKRFSLYIHDVHNKKGEIGIHIIFCFCHCQLPVAASHEYPTQPLDGDFCVCLSVCLSAKRFTFNFEIRFSEFVTMTTPVARFLLLLLFCFVSFNLIFRAFENCLWVVLFRFSSSCDCDLIKFRIGKWVPMLFSLGSVLISHSKNSFFIHQRVPQCCGWH